MVLLINIIFAVHTTLVVSAEKLVLEVEFIYFLCKIMKTNNLKKIILHNKGNV